MAITVDAFAVLSKAWTSGLSTVSNAFTVGAGNQRLLVVQLVFRGGLGIGSVTGVTYAGQAMTRAISTNAPGAGLKYLIETWYLVAPPVGTANVIISYSTGQTNLGFSAISLRGVDPTTPINAPNSAIEQGVAAASFPTVALAISGGNFGLAFGAINYSTSFQGPVDTPSPFTTAAFVNGALDNAGGASTSADQMFLFYGAYDGLLHNASFNANKSANYGYCLDLISLNPYIPLQINIDTTNFAMTDNGEAGKVRASVDPTAFALAMGGKAQNLSMAVQHQAYSLTLGNWRGIRRQLNPFPGGFTLSVPVRRRRFIWPPKGLFPGV